MSVAASLSGPARRLSLAAILCSAFGVGITIGLSIPLVAILLEAEGYDRTTIGAISGVYSVAIFAMGFVVPAVVRRLGTVPSLFVGSVVAVIGFTGLSLTEGVVAWMLLRVLMGAGNAIDWVVSETWINQIATEADRGRIVAIYSTVWGGGVAAGPLVLSLVGTADSTGFTVAIAILVVAFLPVLLARHIAPQVSANPLRGGVFRVAWLAPVGILVALIGGVSEGAVYPLLPLYAADSGYTAEIGVLLTAAYAAGALVFQIPIGWLADRVSRYALLWTMTGLSLVGVGLMPVLIDWLGPALAWSFVWGGIVSGLYTVGLTVLAQRFEGGDMASANAAFIAAYTLGMVLGPVLAGTGMEAIGPSGLIWVLAGSLTVLLVLGPSLRALVERRREG